MASAGDLFGGGFVKEGDNLRFAEGLTNFTPVTFSAAATIGAPPNGIFVGDSGTKLYISDDNNNAIFQFTLSAANSLVGASYASLNYLDSNLTDRGLFFRPDGTRVYYISTSGTKSVQQRTLSTPWNISTASGGATIAINSQVSGTANGLAFKSDGASMYVLDGDSGVMYQYTLSTPWDVSTATYASKSFNIRYLGTANYASNILFNTTGTELSVYDSQRNIPVIVYTLGTPWDIATATFTRLGMARNDNLAQYGNCFSSDGLKLFTISNDEVVREYSLASAYNPSVRVTILNYSGKALLTGLAVKQVPTDTNVYTELQNSMVYVNVDGAGDRLIGNSTFYYQNNQDLSLNEPKIFSGCFAKSKTSLVIKAEARYNHIIEARYSIS
jgi:hypothetical protein